MSAYDAYRGISFEADAFRRETLIVNLLKMNPDMVLSLQRGVPLTADQEGLISSAGLIVPNTSYQPLSNFWGNSPSAGFVNDPGFDTTIVYYNGGAF